MNAPGKHRLLIAGIIVFVFSTMLAACGSSDSTTTTKVDGNSLIICYQNWIADSEGQPVSGDVGVVFHIYDVPDGGSPLWTEEHTVAVGNGAFSLFLGVQNPIPLSLLKDHSALYLGITVGTDGETLPRELLASVPYATRAGGAPMDFSLNGHLYTGGAGIFGRPGVGGGGGIQLVEGEHGIRWYMDNMNNTLRWFNKGGEPSPYIAMRLSPAGELYVFGPAQLGGLDDSDALVLTSPDVKFETNPAWGRGDGGRAFVHGNEDTLIINYGEDFEGGVIVNDFHTGKIIEQGLQTPEEQASAVIPRFSQGDLLCWNAEESHLEKCDTPASPLVVAVADAKGKPIVLGAEPIKVVGPVQPGDLLVSSNVPGYAVAWSQIGEGSPPVGVVMAKALEAFEGKSGLVKAMILGR